MNLFMKLKIEVTQKIVVFKLLYFYSILFSNYMTFNFLNRADIRGGPGMDAQQQQYCLKWNSFGSNLATSFANLWNSESLADVTLYCEGEFSYCHSSHYYCYIFYINALTIK